LVRSDEGDDAQAWAVQYDDGMSLTTASEQIAHGLAEAERQRGHRVTVRRLDDTEAHPQGAGQPVVPVPAWAAEPFESPEPASEPEPAPVPEPAAVAEPEPAPAPAPAAVAEPEPAPVPEPTGQAAPPGLTREPEPARVAMPAGRRRLLLYVLAAVCIVIAAALADYWNVLPRVGAGTSPAQVGSVLHGPRLLPPLGQPPVMHFGH
jgi:outer membrane biosynthesis protein TonB